MNLKSNKKGFLLIEVVASVLIMATAIVFIIRSFSTSLKVVKTSNDYFKATLLLEGLLWPFEAQGGIPKKEFNGEFSDDNIRASNNEIFKYELSSTQDEELSDSDFKINRVISKIIFRQANLDTPIFTVATCLKNKEE